MLGYKKNKIVMILIQLFLDEDIQWANIKNTYQGTQQYYNLLINSSYNFAEKNINSCKDLMFNYLLNKTSDILNIKLDDT